MLPVSGALQLKTYINGWTGSEQSFVVETVTSESHGKAPIMRAARQYLIHTFNKNP